MINAFFAGNAIFEVGKNPDSLSLLIFAKGIGFAWVTYPRRMIFIVAYSMQNLPQERTPYRWRRHLKLIQISGAQYVRMPYTVVAECWSIFESALMVQAHKLVKDIAKDQGSDVKELWAKIRPTTKVNLIDIELPEQPLCTEFCHRDGSAVLERCRAPCLLGFERCPSHLGSVSPEGDKDKEAEEVERFLDHEGATYFVDKDNNVRDKTGIIQGVVEDDVFYAFVK